jgi:hypothetical protein
VTVRGPLVLVVAAALGGVALAQGEAQTFSPTVTERLALGALLERQRALEADIRAVLTDAAKARGVPPARLSYDPGRGVLVLAAEPAPVATGARGGGVAPGP